MTTSPASSAEELDARVAQNLSKLRSRIASSARDPATVRIVAVTKTFDLDAVRAALTSGLGHVGENYADELAAKYEAARGLDVAWHFIGTLQSNKITRVCSFADVVATVSRLKELEKIARSPRRPLLYIQVDYSGGASRNGASSGEVSTLVRRARELELDVRGLMTVAVPDPLEARSAFAKLNELRVDQGLVESSMGMSDDLEIACELGSTELRIGRALFGERDAR